MPNQIEGRTKMIPSNLMLVLAPVVALAASLGAIALIEMLSVGLYRMHVIYSDSVNNAIITVSATVSLATGVLWFSNIQDFGLPLYLYVVFISGGVAGLVFKIYLRGE